MQLLTLVSAFIINNGLMGFYEFDLMNFLTDPIVVKINQRRVDNKDYYQIINSFESAKQVFDNAYCLEKMSWAPYDKNKPLNGGMDLVDQVSGRIPKSNQRQFGDRVAPRYAFSPIEIKIEPSEVFQQTSKAAKELLKGLDTLACQTLNETKSFLGITATERLAKKLGDLGDDSKDAIEGATKADDTPSDLKDPEKCSFSLGKIGDASGKLAGYTLCKSREFHICYKLNENDQPIKDMRYGGRPKVLALTGEGE